MYLKLYVIVYISAHLVMGIPYENSDISLINQLIPNSLVLSHLDEGALDRLIHKTLMQEKEKKLRELQRQKQHELEAFIFKKYLGGSRQRTSFLNDFHTLRY